MPAIVIHSFGRGVGLLDGTSNDLLRRLPDYVAGIRREAERPLMERPMTDYALAYDPAAMLPPV